MPRSSLILGGTAAAMVLAGVMLAGLTLASLTAFAGTVPLPASAANRPTWRRPDPAHTLVIDTTRGRIVVELQPALAPVAVARMERLAHQGFYDGLLFHRVIDGFMAQTGDPGNVDGGKSPLPNLKPEFTFRRGLDSGYVEAARPAGWTAGFIGPTPVMGAPDAAMSRSPDHRAAMWVTYCPGVVGMGRDEPPDSANSEFFLMRNAWPSLDRLYTPVGRVLRGLQVLRALKTGEPVRSPDAMVRVRLAADLPLSDRPAIQVMDTLSPAFAAEIASARRAKSADFSVCDVKVPVRER